MVTTVSFYVHSRRLREWLEKHGVVDGWTHFLRYDSSIVSARELPKEEVVHALDA